MPAAALRCRGCRRPWQQRRGAGAGAPSSVPAHSLPHTHHTPICPCQAGTASPRLWTKCSPRPQWSNTCAPHLIETPRLVARLPARLRARDWRQPGCQRVARVLRRASLHPAGWRRRRVTQRRRAASALLVHHQCKLPLTIPLDTFPPWQVLCDLANINEAYVADASTQVGARQPVRAPPRMPRPARAAQRPWRGSLALPQGRCADCEGLLAPRFMLSHLAGGSAAEGVPRHPNRVPARRRLQVGRRRMAEGQRSLGGHLSAPCPPRTCRRVPPCAPRPG